VCIVHCVTVYRHTVHDTHALQVTICSHNTDDVLYSLYVFTFNHVCNF